MFLYDDLFLDIVTFENLFKVINKSRDAREQTDALNRGMGIVMRKRIDIFAHFQDIAEDVEYEEI